VSALTRLMIAGAAAALFSAPALAADVSTKLDAAFDTTTVAQQQDDCRGWGVRCELDVSPTYCIADDVCATALPATALVRYDQHMDAVLGR
jgi:hypothetical protein